MCIDGWHPMAIPATLLVRRSAYHIDRFSFQLKAVITQNLYIPSVYTQQGMKCVKTKVKILLEMN